jgi:hypothetical protein
MTISGIACDKALLLRGEMPGFDVNILVQVLTVIRERRDEEDRDFLARKQ